MSRSSVLATKATDYLLAFIAARLGLSIPHDEVKTQSTKATSACFEPRLVHVVVKALRWESMPLVAATRDSGVGGVIFCEGAFGLDAWLLSHMAPNSLGIE